MRYLMPQLYELKTFCYNLGHLCKSELRPSKARHYTYSLILWFWAFWLSFIKCCFRLVEEKHPNYPCKCLFYCTLLPFSQNEFVSPLQQHLHALNLAVLFLSIFWRFLLRRLCSYNIRLVLNISFLKTWRFYHLWSDKNRNPKSIL